ncbi:MAG: hypothetical protein NTV30_11100, partial [Chloroflexi bacterium]|nr:hypothetical protein [Chloroflexota bacterium]
EDGDRRLFLDFGFPYKRHKLFYEEYLRPRSGAGLLDPLSMGLLPPLEGIYRNDYNSVKMWQQLQNQNGYRKIDKIDGVLLTHAHLDHSGYISFLNENIPVYSTLVTAYISKAMQDSGKSDFDQSVCYFNPVEAGIPSGWKQQAFLTCTGPKQQRQFCIADSDPNKLNTNVHEFWTSGFWEKSARQKNISFLNLKPHSGCSFNLKCFPVDHSIPGACAWGIETSSGWIIYSGDLRFHGKKSTQTTQFVKDAALLNPRALIIEGTNVRRINNIAENDVYENALKAIHGSSGLVIADFPPRDVDRLLTFLKVAIETGRKLAILPKDAYLLKTMRLLDSNIPDVGSNDNLVIYQDTIASKSPSLWIRNICQDYSNKLVLASDIHESQKEFILCFSFFDINELPSIQPARGSLYVFSSSEPHDEEQEIDFHRLHNWLEHFGMKGFGLPLEINGQWQIPEAERGLHASGHACGPDLIDAARNINPEILLPVHSEFPQYYKEQLKNIKTKVCITDQGNTIEV